MTTDEERASYAQAQRAACQPFECTAAPGCWVAEGGKSHLIQSTKSERCLACGGKLRLKEWRHPPELAMTEGHQRRARQHNAKRKRQLDFSF